MPARTRPLQRQDPDPNPKRATRAIADPKRRLKRGSLSCWNRTTEGLRGMGRVMDWKFWC